MAAKFKPVTVEKDGVQRVADTPARLVAYEWDGFTQVQDAEATKAPTRAQAGGGGSKSKDDGTADTAGTNPK